MDRGGFPRSPHATIPRHISSFGDILHPPDQSKDWLIYDLFLGDALAGLGLNWKGIEDAMTDAFLAALPSVYPPLLTAADVPRALAFLLWRHDLEHWRFFRVHGQAIQREAAKMSRMLWKTPDGPGSAAPSALTQRQKYPRRQICHHSSRAEMPGRGRGRLRGVGGRDICACGCAIRAVRGKEDRAERQM